MANRQRIEQIEEFSITLTTVQHGMVPKWNNNTGRFDWVYSLLQLGDLHSEAYYGDLGKIAYDHSQLVIGNPHNVTKAQVGLTNVTDNAQWHNGNHPTTTTGYGLPDYPTITQYTDTLARQAISSSATGLTYTNTTGVFSLTSGYVIPTTTQETNWGTAYTNRITSLTTIGSSGTSTLVNNTLNIPNYTLSGLGGQASNTNLDSLSGLTFVSTSFVKMTAANTFGLDTTIYQSIPIDITYTALKILVDAENLVSGQIYKITDYETTYLQPVTNIQTSSGVIEQLLVTAISAMSFNPMCSSLLYTQDIVYYDINDNTEGFTKGKIYRRVTPTQYLDIVSDWRHIKYRRWKLNVTTVWVSGNNYTKADIVTDVTQTYIYIAPYDIINSTDINELIRYPYKNGEYTSLLPTGQGVCVGTELTYNATIPVTADYQDFYLVPNLPSIKLFEIQISNVSNDGISPFTLMNTVIFSSTIVTKIVFNYVRRCTIGIVSAIISEVYLNNCGYSNIGQITASRIHFCAYLSIGNLAYSSIGQRCSGLLAGNYKTTANVNGEQNQLIDIKDHSYGWIIGNGIQNANISYKSKFGTIGSNCASISVGSFTNNLLLKANNTNWDIGSQLELAAKTLPVVSNDYAKTIYKAGAKVLCEYTDEFSDVNITEL